MTLDELVAMFGGDAPARPGEAIQSFASQKSNDFFGALDRPNMIPTMYGEQPGPSALDGMKSVAEMGANLYPSPVADALSAKDAVEQFGQGNYGWGALSALGALPMVPSLGIFAGKAAKTADQNLLREAMRLGEAGAGADEVYKQTKWFKTPWDQQWKFEIPDTNLNVNPGEGAAKDIFQHSALYDAYPEIGGYPTKAVEEKWFGGGEFNSKTKNIVAKGSGDKLKRTAAHELQHAVQEIEGFGRGGSPMGISFDLITQKADAAMELFRINRAYEAALANPGTGDLLALLSEKNRLQNKVDALTKYNALPFDVRQPGIYQAYKALPGEAESRLVERRLAYPPIDSSLPLNDLDMPIEDILTSKNNDYESLIKNILLRAEK